MKILKAANLAKSYDGRQIVKDVTIEVESGQIVGLLGPNGAGKTTCFYMIVNLVQADQGRVTIDDEDISHLPMHGRRPERHRIPSAGSIHLPQTQR